MPARDAEGEGEVDHRANQTRPDQTMPKVMYSRTEPSRATAKGKDVTRGRRSEDALCVWCARVREEEEEEEEDGQNVRAAVNMPRAVCVPCVP